MPKSTHTPSPPLPTLQVIHDELHYHGRMLALAACMGASLCTENLIVLSARLIAMGDRLALGQKEERP